MTKESNQTFGRQDIAWDIVSVVGQFKEENPHILQIVMQNPDLFFGLQRTDSAEGIYEEMRAFMPVRRIVLREETDSIPGYSLIIGSTPAGSPHTIWSANYEIFQAIHEASVKEYIAGLSEPSTHSQEQQVLTEYPAEDTPYILYNWQHTADKKQVPLHFVTWMYLEREFNEEKSLLPVDIYAMSGAGGRKNNLLKFDLLEASELLDLQKVVFQELSLQLDTLSRTITRMFNALVLPQVNIVLERAFQKGLLARKPKPDELEIFQEEIVRYAGIGHDTESELYGTNRGPQSIPTLHFHVNAPSFRSRLVKLVSGRNSLDLTEEEQRNFLELMQMISSLDISAGEVKYQSLQEQTAGSLVSDTAIGLRDLVKQIDVYGSLISHEVLNPLRETVERILHKALPGKNLEVSVYKVESTASTLQALRTSGWKIKVESATAQEVLPVLSSILEDWYKAQLQVVNAYDSTWVDESADMSRSSLESLNPQQITEGVAEIISQLQPTQALLRFFAEGELSAKARTRIKREDETIDTSVQRHEQQQRARVILYDWMQQQGNMYATSQELCNAFLADERAAGLKNQIKREVYARMNTIFATELLDDQRFASASDAERLDEVKRLLKGNSKRAKTWRKRRASAVEGLWRAASRVVWKVATDPHWSERWELPHTILRRLQAELLVETGRNENMCRVPGFVVAWEERETSNGGLETKIRLAPSVNERGGVESIWGMLIKRKEQLR